MARSLLNLGIAIAVAIFAIYMIVQPAQAQTAEVLANCGTVSGYVAGQFNYPTVNTSGLYCTSATATGTFDDAAVSSTNSGVPGSASYGGINVGGNLQGQTGYHPANGGYAADVVTGGNSFSNLTTAATTTIKSGAGVLHTVCVNTLGTVASTITIYDNTAASGTKIGTINSLTFLGCMTYDVAFATGLTVVVTGTAAPDATVSWR